MVRLVEQAVAWGLLSMLRVNHDDRVAHQDLEHAHWDPVAREWFMHEDERDASVSPAA